jgi:hypothetical protein
MNHPGVIYRGGRAKAAAREKRSLSAREVLRTGRAIPLGRQPSVSADYRQHVSGLMIGNGFDRGDGQLAGFGKRGSS